MGWLATDKNGTSWIYDEKPERDILMWNAGPDIEYVRVSNATATLLFGRIMYWEDEPIEV